MLKQSSLIGDEVYQDRCVSFITKAKKAVGEIWNRNCTQRPELDAPTVQTLFHAFNTAIASLIDNTVDSDFGAAVSAICGMDKTENKTDIHIAVIFKPTMYALPFYFSIVLKREVIISIE